MKSGRWKSRNHSPSRIWEDMALLVGLENFHRDKKEREEKKNEEENTKQKSKGNHNSARSETIPIFHRDSYRSVGLRERVGQSWESSLAYLPHHLLGGPVWEESWQAGNEINKSKTLNVDLGPDFLGRRHFGNATAACDRRQTLGEYKVEHQEPIET